MTRAELIGVMRSVMTEQLRLPQMARFSEQARLNEDLCLDSVMVLQLVVSLELQHGLVLPEQAILEKQLGTVGSLADFLLLHRATPATPGDTLSTGARP